MVRHRDRFGVALRLVVHRAWADAVDVAEVRLGLRVHQRVAVDLAGGNAQEACTVVAREVEGALVPIAPTSRVSIGWARYSGGLAGLARCSTASTGPETGMPLMMSCSTRTKPVSSARWATFSRLPVRKLSTATTSHSRRSVSQRCEPTNPAPPVTTARGISGRRPGRRTLAGASPLDRAGLRPSTRARARSWPRLTRAKSSQRNSSHSVSSVSRPAPCPATPWFRTGHPPRRAPGPAPRRPRRRAGRRPGRWHPRRGAVAHHQRRRVAEVVGVGLEGEGPHADRHPLQRDHGPRQLLEHGVRAGDG